MTRRAAEAGPGGSADPMASAGEETAQQRTTRRWNEMLQELRVAQTGVQVLTGFLLTVPFTQRFGDLAQLTKYAFLATLTSSIVATGLLIAPVAFHRVLFGKSEKEWLVEAANNSARAGLAMLAVTVTGVMFVVFDVVVNRVAATVAAGATLGLLGALWLAVPLMGGEHDQKPAEDRAGQP